MRFHFLALVIGLTLLGLNDLSSAAPGFRDQNTVPEEAILLVSSFEKP